LIFLSLKGFLKKNHTIFLNRKNNICQVKYRGLQKTAEISDSTDFDSIT